MEQMYVLGAALVAGAVFLFWLISSSKKAGKNELILDNIQKRETENKTLDKKEAEVRENVSNATDDELLADAAKFVRKPPNGP